MFGHSMTGLYINECSNALDEFKLELDKIVDAKKRLRFDRLRFGFREGDKMSYYDVSKEEYLRCKCDIVKPIFNMLYDGFYSCEDCID
jgi:hypothetical protein